MKTKKLIALLLSLVMVIGLLPAMAAADGDTHSLSIYVGSNNTEVIFNYTADREGSITQIGTYDNGSTTGAVNVYLMSLPYGAELTSVPAVKSLGMYGKNTDRLLYKPGNTSYPLLAETNYLLNDEFTNPTKYKNYNTIYKGVIEGSAYNDNGYSLPNENVKGFLCYTTLQNLTQCAWLFIQISTLDPNAGSTDKSDLNAAIAKVWSGDATTGSITGNYHTVNDRYNGKDPFIRDKTSGFWKQYGEPALRDALEVAENDNASQTTINTAYGTLNDAIAKLIPISQANTTVLYDAVKEYKDTTNSYGGKSPYWTDASWNNFTAKRDAAETLMDSMFNVDGSANTTYNVYAAQADVEAKAAALTQAYNNLFPIVLNEKLGVWKAAADWLLGKSDLDSSKYDATTWTTWEEKLAALEGVKNSTITLNSDYDVYTKAIVEATAACNALADKNESITVHVRVADNFATLYPQYALKDAATATFDADVTLSNGHSIDALLTAMAYDNTPLEPIQTSGTVITNVPCVMAYINGTLAVYRNEYIGYWSGKLLSGETSYKDQHIADIQLHDGDDVVLVRAQAPYYSYYISTIPNAPYRSYYKSAALLDILSDSHVVEVEAGAELSLNVSKRDGAPESTNRGAKPGIGVSLFLSDVQADQATAQSAVALTPADAVTDGSGSAKLTLFAEGWYKLFAADVHNATGATQVMESEISEGTYPNLAGGDYVLVHVKPASDETALRAQFQAALDKVYNAHGEDYYGARWSGEQGVQAIYNAASNVIAGKDPNKPLLGNAKSASDSAIAAIEGIIAEIEAATETALDAFQWVSDMLPDDVSLLTKLQIEAVTQLKEIYAGMTAHQQSLLTGAQTKKYKAILEKFGEDGSTLPEGTQYTVHVVIDNEADKEKYDFVLDTSYVLQGITGQLNRIDAYGSVSYGAGANQKFQFVPGSRSINLYLFPVGYSAGGTTPPCTITNVTVEGSDYTLNERDHSSPLTYRQINPARYYLQSLTLTAPYNDITVHLTVRDSNAPKTTDELKAEAKAALTQAYQNDYPKSQYNTAQWAELTSAYNAGLAAIDAAEESSIEAAKAAAIEAMGLVKTIDKADHSDSTVGSLGSVHVIVENTTYTGAPASMQGRFVERDMPLEADTTMMNAVLDALALEGYSWVGTGPGSSTGREITYLATITDSDGATLSEFDGEPTSGWMGVLNDWFVNESFASFSTTATARDYRIVDGDEIRVMFTLKGYGRDLGGSWGNPDTSIKELSYTGGTLTPKFDGAMTDYVLTLTGGAVSVTPTAANKNYQVKTFLNQKNTARDVEYYRRGETIPARAGDVIWIGCGEHGWLSMNNQGAEATGYSGTWYCITVVDSNSAAAAEQAIEKIGRVTYANYKSKEAAVKAARAAYDNLSAAAKEQVTNSAKLTAAEQKIEDYKEIDNVKALLADLPKEATDAQVLAAADKIRAAEAAYLALEKWQQDYITVGDAAKYNALVTKWKELTPEEEQDSIPQLIAGGSGGEKKDKKDEGAEIAAATVTVTPEVVNGAAQAEVKAEDVTAALLEAGKDAETLTVKVETEGADTVAASLPADAVKAAADAGVGLNVETENGTVKIDAGTLAEAAKAGKDVAVTVTENKDGTTTVGVTSDGKAVEADVKIELEAKDGQMLVVVGPDGAETPVILSASEDGTMYAQVPAGSTVKVVDAEGKEFGDVKAGDWFAEAVEFVSSHGIFQGTGDGTFAPGTTMNRAMLAMVLYRIDGAAGGGSSTFGDVDPGAWYADAVSWAADAGIVNGRGEGFAPDAPVTREEIATMLYRFVQYLGVDVSGAADLSKFPDGGDTSPWAGEAMQWAVSVGLFRGGSGGALNPGGEATRAEVATLVERLVTLLVK